MTSSDATASHGHNLPPGRALVTGATAGIGLAIAEQLAARGHDLVLVARDEQRLAEVAQRLRTEHGRDVEVLRADLADREQLALVEARLARGDVDLLVNNAGFGVKGNLLDNDVETEQAMLDVLVVAVMRLTRAQLVARRPHHSGGVINVSSVASDLPRGTYGAAKAYVTSLTKWADLTYRAEGLRAMALLPGFVRTEFHGRMDVSFSSAPGFMWLDAERVAREALKDYAAGKTVCVPSKRYKVMRRVTSAAPGGVLAKFQKVGRR